MSSRVLAAIGLAGVLGAGCDLTKAQACLSIPYDPGDSGDSGDSGEPPDIRDVDASTTDVTHRVLGRGVLPSDIADKLGAKLHDRTRGH